MKYIVFVLLIVALFAWCQKQNNVLNSKQEQFVLTWLDSGSVSAWAWR